jgi:hypothetical protein
MTLGMINNPNNPALAAIRHFTHADIVTDSSDRRMIHAQLTTKIDPAIQ